jgi:hypothetical protein
VGLHEGHVSTAWAISVVLGGTRQPTTGARRSTLRETPLCHISLDINLPAKGPDLYRVDPELKLLVLRVFVSLIYRPITNPANKLNVEATVFSVLFRNYIMNIFENQIDFKSL